MMTTEPLDAMPLDQTIGDDGEVLEVFELRPARAQINLRLDRFVATELPELSRVYVQHLIERGGILVDGIARRSAFKMTPGEVVTVAVPPAEEFHLEPESIPLAVIYEDVDILVIDKTAGMVVHPAPGHSHGTLVNAVLAHVPNLAVGGVRRPGIVHRLDKDTSGVMVVAKNNRAHASLVRQWQERTVEKHYRAVVAGVVEEEEATVSAPIGRDPKHRQRMTAIRTGRDAVTHLRVLSRAEASTYLDINIHTGRTHQIRVHLAFIGFPVVGDGVYGNARSEAIVKTLSISRHFLHASELGFELPGGGWRRFDAPLPHDLRQALAELGHERPGDAHDQ